MTIGDRIRLRRKQLGLSVDDLAKSLGKNRTTVYRYESDEIENLPLNVLDPLAKALHVTPAYLMGWEDNTIKIKTKSVPLLGDITAGEPIYACEERYAYVEIEDDCNIDFCLRVKGDSMVDAGINDGDLVFVRKQPYVDNGEIAVVLIDDDATLKRFYKITDGVILKPENSRYQPLFFKDSDFKNIRILGKVIYSQGVIR
jgi:repressor LexA